MSIFHRTHVLNFLTIFTRLEPTATGGELWIACEGTGVSTGGCAHSLLFLLQCRPRSPTRVQAFVRMLGYVLVRHPTVILSVSGCEEGECLDMCITDNRP